MEFKDSLTEVEAVIFEWVFDRDLENHVGNGDRAHLAVQITEYIQKNFIPRNKSQFPFWPKKKDV